MSIDKARISLCSESFEHSTKIRKLVWGPGCGRRYDRLKHICNACFVAPNTKEDVTPVTVAPSWRGLRKWGPSYSESTMFCRAYCEMPWITKKMYVVELIDCKQCVIQISKRWFSYRSLSGVASFCLRRASVTVFRSYTEKTKDRCSRRGDVPMFYLLVRQDSTKKRSYASLLSLTLR